MNRQINFYRAVRLLCCGGIALILGAVDCASAAEPAELAELVAAALSGNPRVQAARHRVDQMLAKHEATFGFLDPSMFAATGYAQRSRGTPGASGFTALTDNALDNQAGVQTPLRPGAYLAVGGAERLLTEPGDGSNQQYQSLASARLRIPLLRDRGFRLWDSEQAMAVAEYNQEVSQFTAAIQQLRWEIELAYIAVLEAAEIRSSAHDATVRLSALLNETKELVRLKVVPEYQLHPTVMEKSLREEEEISAKDGYEQALIRLRQVVGGGGAVAVSSGVGALVEWAAGVTLSESDDVAVAMATRGDSQAILNQVEFSHAELGRAEENLRSDLDLNLGTSWQGESPNNPFGGGRALSGHHMGGDMTLVWSKTLGLRRERAEVHRLESRIAELMASLAQMRDLAVAEIAAARLAYQSAQDRLRAVEGATEAARKEMEAEEERFRLGEGRSRQVLDAQQDLNGVSQRRTHIAAALLRAHSSYRRATGYVGQELALQPSLPPTKP
ncbi:MAG: hypothetical protein A3K19_14220 [Lentisphaerae bacterium RIFOXYB12_FULL_65_16]|nr:MAG: hypothetical protein A3K18_16265 [Lentisphaerae bacterium RIFOXYA12_64_32]OGV89121.1 MAG: hypothetical protein A3K19_14220 [Lentisphaerae bacterium RIFOXYB12_FULL_65_16]